MVTERSGVIIDAGKFDWSNGKFLSDFSAGYQVIYHDVLNEASFIAKARIEGLRDLGAAPSIYFFSNFARLRNFGRRMKRHSENALSLSKWLESKEEVT